MRMDFPHFWPRFGVAVAAHRERKSVEELESLSEQELAELLASVIETELGYFMLKTDQKPEYDKNLKFDWVKLSDLDPIRSKHQNSKHGYYLAPHVTTGSNFKQLFKKASECVEILRSGDARLATSSDGLQRSFAPLVSKINNGRSGMADPKASLLEAAYSTIATLAKHKPATFALPPTEKDPKKKANYALIPDLPLRDKKTGHYPLIDFVSLFSDMHEGGLGVDHFKAERYEKREQKQTKIKITYGYSRPRIFRGNYPDSPQDPSLGALGLVAAIGVWAREAGSFRGDPRGAFAERVLLHLERNPLYLVSHDGHKTQERFGHHLVQFALEYPFQLRRLSRDLRQAKLYTGIESSQRLHEAKRRGSSEEIERKRRHNAAVEHQQKLLCHRAARFVQTLENSAFRSFLAFRASYPLSFTPILRLYFMKQTMSHLPEERRKEIVDSACAFGSEINSAAYKAAKREVNEDQKRGKATRTVPEEKARKLVVMETAAMSARTHSGLMKQLSVMTGRLTGRDFGPEARTFMKAVCSMEVSLNEAKDLAVTFMRLWPDRAQTDSRSKAGKGEDGNTKNDVDSDDGDLQQESLFN